MGIVALTGNTQFYIHKSLLDSRKAIDNFVFQA